MIELAVAEGTATISTAQADSTAGVSAENISKIFRISNEEAENTIAATSQLNHHDGNTSLSRNFITNDHMLRYRRLNSIYFTNIIFVTNKAKSACGNIGAQIYVSDKGAWIHIHYASLCKRRRGPSRPSVR